MEEEDGDHKISDGDGEIFLLLMTLKEELPGWECGEAKQGV